MPQWAGTLERGRTGAPEGHWHQPEFPSASHMDTTKVAQPTELCQALDSLPSWTVLGIVSSTVSGIVSSTILDLVFKEGVSKNVLDKVATLLIFIIT